MCERITIRIAEGGLAATMSVAEGPASGPPTVEAALRGAGVVLGIDARVVEEIGTAMQDPGFVARDVVIARGVEPTAGRDEQVELRFRPGIKAASVDGSGRRDYRARGLIDPVAVGDVLAELVPAQRGVSGRQVDGDAIEPPAPKRVSVALGDGVERRGAAIVATRDGAIAYAPGPSFAVVEHFEHSGDVDLKSGDLRMQGAVTVTGTVSHGFIVRATGDVEIKGSVSAGLVVGGAAVVVDGGVTGGSTGRIVATGPLSVRHAQAAVLHSGDSIAVEADVVGGQLFGRTIAVGGRVRSADLRAAAKIDVGEAGAPAGSKAVLAAGVPLEPAVADLARDALRVAKTRRQTRARAGSRLRARTRKGRSAELQAAASKTESRVAMRREQRTLMRTANVIVQRTLHAGVVIRIGALTKITETTTTGRRFHADLDDNVVVGEPLAS